ncbi:phage terminase small subunit-related protein [Bacillus sp. FSL R5-0560]
MPRPRDPRRDEAFRLWEESGGSKKLKTIEKVFYLCSDPVSP